MAETNTTTDLELIVSEESVTLNKKRAEVLLDAAFEIEKLAEVLRESVPLCDNNVFYAVRGITGRINDLASIIMSSIDDKVEKTPDLWARLNVKPSTEFV